MCRGESRAGKGVGCGESELRGVGEGGEGVGERGVSEEGVGEEVCEGDGIGRRGRGLGMTGNERGGFKID